MPEIQTSILNGLFIADSEQCKTGCQQKTNVNINKYNWDKICCMAEEVSHRGHTDKVRNQCFMLALKNALASKNFLIFWKVKGLVLRDQFDF